MSLHDFRTKPDSEWTYYVVDHLPTMSNIYRYDTIGEAIDKFQELPSTQRSAIGSSLNSTHEIDHIHRLDGQAVLVTDIERTKDPIWRDSKKIQTAVSLMKHELKVNYELNSDIFIKGISVAIPLSDPFHSLNSYFNNKRLDPKIIDRPLSGINEVHTSNHGWIKAEDFLNMLRNRKWSQESGYPVYFVNQINIRYADKNGHKGQADITPQDFIQIKRLYEKNLEGKSTLEEQIYGAVARTSRDDSNEKSSFVFHEER